jgi:cell division protein FtsN
MEQPSGSPAIKSAPKTQSALPLSTTKVVTTSALVKLAPEKPLAAVPPGKTMLHICSFKQKANAEKEVQRLEKNGYKSFLAEEEISGQRWFRVYIGNFKDEQEARKVGSELKRKGLISYFKPTKVDESIRR